MIIESFLCSYGANLRIYWNSLFTLFQGHGLAMNPDVDYANIYREISGKLQKYGFFRLTVRKIFRQVNVSEARNDFGTFLLSILFHNFKQNTLQNRWLPRILMNTWLYLHLVKLNVKHWALTFKRKRLL